jgi:outer membrane protein assembly factor BamB
VAGEKGAIYAFDKSGKQIWKKQVNGEVLSAPLVGNGLVIVRTTDTRLIGWTPRASDAGSTSARRRR